MSLISNAPQEIILNIFSHLDNPLSVSTVSSFFNSIANDDQLVHLFLEKVSYTIRPYERRVLEHNINIISDERPCSKMRALYKCIKNFKERVNVKLENIRDVLSFKEMYLKEVLLEERYRNRLNMNKESINSKKFVGFSHNFFNRRPKQIHIQAGDTVTPQEFREFEISLKKIQHAMTMLPKSIKTHDLSHFLFLRHLHLCSQVPVLPRLYFSVHYKEPFDKEPFYYIVPSVFDSENLNLLILESKENKVWIPFLFSDFLNIGTIKKVKLIGPSLPLLKINDASAKGAAVIERLSIQNNPDLESLPEGFDKLVNLKKLALKKVFTKFPKQVAYKEDLHVAFDLALLTNMEWKERLELPYFKGKRESLGVTGPLVDLQNMLLSDEVLDEELVRERLEEIEKLLPKDPENESTVFRNISCDDKDLFRKAVNEVLLERLNHYFPVESEARNAGLRFNVYKFWSEPKNGDCGEALELADWVVLTKFLPKISK